ncbi:unnamed protein product, partial [Closterium sp. NIES-53]
ASTRQMRGGVPGRHPDLLKGHEAAHQTPTTCLRDTSTGVVLRQDIQERVCHEEGSVPWIHGERSRSPCRPKEDRSRTYVEDTGEREETVIVIIGLNVPKTKDRVHRRISAERLQTFIAFWSQLQMT